MADRWTWTPAQWLSILELADAEQRNRRAAQAQDPISRSLRPRSLARANEAAAMMRRWASIAGDRRMQPDDPRLAPGAAAAVRAARMNQI